jgi:predicted DNA-binding transcriptional regulator AlpA
MTDASRVPAWVDKATLCRETCLSERCVDNWVRDGRLPPARHRGGKLMWRWAEVDRYLDVGGPSVQNLSVEDQVRQRARALRERA